MMSSEPNEVNGPSMELSDSATAPHPANLPIVAAGQQLAEHEVYIDTSLRGHGPFRALPGQVAASGNGYVAERDVDAATWDRLVREDGDVQLHDSGETTASASCGQLTELGATV